LGFAFFAIGILRYLKPVFYISTNVLNVKTLANLATFEIETFVVSVIHREGLAWQGTVQDDGFEKRKFGNRG